METFTFLTVLVLGLAVSLIVQLSKKFKNFGSMGTKLVVFVIGLVIALFQYGWTFVPAQYAQTILTVMAGAIAWYELVLKEFADWK